MSTLISVESEWPCSAAWLSAVVTLMARSPAIPCAPRPSAGNESTSVALFLPRNCRLSFRIAASVVSRTVTCPRRRTAARAALRKRARVRAEGSFKSRCTDLEADREDAAEGFAGFVFGEGSGSRSGSRIIIVHVAAMHGHASSSILLDVAVF